MAASQTAQTSPTRDIPLERIDVQAYWRALSSDKIIEPTMKKVQFEYRLLGCKNYVCGVFVVYNKRELCYVVSQAMVDQLSYCGSNHIIVMQIILDDLGLKNKKPKFDYIAGFFYIEQNEKKEKYNSSANSYYSAKREVTDSFKKMLDKHVFPQIIDKLKHFKGDPKDDVGVRDPPPTA